jgi:predicted ester cyclase
MVPAARRGQAAAMTETTAAPTTHHTRLVDAFVQELFTHGDLTAVDRYLDPAFVDHDPPWPGGPDGSEGMRQAAVLFRSACPDWHSDLEQLVEEGDVVVERFTARGTRLGELIGAPATGEPVELRGINVFRIAGDRIVERWGRLDELGLARQLGLVPGPDGAGPPPPDQRARAGSSTVRPPAATSSPSR